MVAAAESPDGLVEVTAGVFGDLRGLWLDPRADLDGVGARVLLATRIAAAAAAWSAAGVPRGTPLGDLAFDPVLREIDRRIAEPRPSAVDGRPSPVLDHRALRRELERVRDAIAEIRETARSTDGAVTVTVGGRGELLDLVVDRRSRHATAAVLADRVLATSRLAVARVGDRLRGVS